MHKQQQQQQQQQQQHQSTKQVTKMSVNTKSAISLEDLIQNAVKKIEGKKENDICRYLPISTGGYIHHFTMRKMKTEAPEDLQSMISKYILSPKNPTKVTPKQRAARGSRKRRDQLLFSKTDLERMLNIARFAGDKDMIRKLTPKKDLRTIKRELIASIKHDNTDHDLWNSFVEAVTCQHAAAHAQPTFNPLA